MTKEKFRDVKAAAVKGGHFKIVDAMHGTQPGASAIVAEPYTVALQFAESGRLERETRRKGATTTNARRAAIRAAEEKKWGGELAAAKRTGISRTALAKRISRKFYDGSERRWRVIYNYIRNIEGR